MSGTRNWTAVSGGDTWNPTVKKNADGSKLELKPTENSFIEGYYLGCKHEQGPDKNSTVHSFLATVIDGKPLEEEKNIQVWGTQTVNDALQEVRPGTFTHVKWLGKQPAKTAGGRPYHTWQVLQDKSDFRGDLVGLSAPAAAAPVVASAPAPVVGSAGIAPSPAPVVTTPVAQPAVQAAPATAVAPPDDDLPF